MPIDIYWGEDDFALDRAVQALRDRTLDPTWGSFNFDKITPDRSDSVIEGLNQAMTPPFGSGGRLVWLVDTTLCQHCSAELLAELERTVRSIPDSTVLLLTSRNKPDGRLKSTKLLKEVAREFQEFSPIPPWKTDDLVKRVRQVAAEVGVKLTQKAVDCLAESVGNNTRQLFGELEKLRLYAGDSTQPIEIETVERLVSVTTQNSLQLAEAIRKGDVGTALALVADLLDRNESAIKISATLTSKFRTWLWVKLMIERGERDDKKIADVAEIGNPKRLFFFRQEVQSLKLAHLQQTLPILLDLEFNLKRGAQERSILQTKVIELCQLYRSRR
jgi:DNA polymerase III subunit delta